MRQIPVSRMALRGIAAMLTCFAMALPVTAQASAGKRPPILGISHICYDVTDLSKTRAFYEDLLGYQEYKIPGRENSASPIALIKINDRQYVELLQVHPPARRGPLSCIAFYTDNAERMRKYLFSKGFSVPAKLSKNEAGELSFRLEDPDGNTIEMVQRAPMGWMAREQGKLMSDNRISNHLSSVGFPVLSYERAQRFYSEILGFREFWSGNVNGGTANLINLRAPESKDYIAYMLYSGNYPLPAQLNVMERITLLVPDIHQAIADLESRPPFKTYGTKIAAHVAPNNKWAANQLDPDGTRIQFMEPGQASQPYVRP
jgi:catechol 2,3-dioxygenase-like lactoylglutathione lyase family enzyme